MTPLNRYSNSGWDTVLLRCTSTSHTTWIQAKPSWFSFPTDEMFSSCIDNLCSVEGLYCHRGARGAAGPPECPHKDVHLCGPAWGAYFDPLKEEPSWETSYWQRRNLEFLSSCCLQVDVSRVWCLPPLKAGLRVAVSGNGILQGHCCQSTDRAWGTVMIVALCAFHKAREDNYEYLLM